MSIHAIVPPFHSHEGQTPSYAQSAGVRRPAPFRARKNSAPPVPVRFAAQIPAEEGTYRQAELFYLQKQIQSQTPMVIVLEDGEKIEGCIEWYDRNSLKIRGRNKTLVYKAAVKYMYKLGEQGQ